MSKDVLDWLEVAKQTWGYLEPVLRKKRLKSALIKRGKSEAEAQMYLQSLEFMKSDYVKLIIQLPTAAELIPSDLVFQTIAPWVFDVVFDDEYAGIWLKDWDKINRMRTSIRASDWVDMLKAK